METAEAFSLEKFLDEFYEYLVAHQRMMDSIKALRAWRRARPFLFDGQCWYSRQLLQTILDSYLVCCRFQKEEPDQKIVDGIRKLMSSELPPRTPPSRKILEAA